MKTRESTITELIIELLRAALTAQRELAAAEINKRLTNPFSPTRMKITDIINNANATAQISDAGVVIDEATKDWFDAIGLYDFVTDEQWAAFSRDVLNALLSMPDSPRVVSAATDLLMEEVVKAQPDCDQPGLRAALTAKMQEYFPNGSLAELPPSQCAAQLGHILVWLMATANVGLAIITRRLPVFKQAAEKLITA